MPSMEFVRYHHLACPWPNRHCSEGRRGSVVVRPPRQVVHQERQLLRFWESWGRFQLAPLATIYGQPNRGMERPCGHRLK